MCFLGNLGQLSGLIPFGFRRLHGISRDLQVEKRLVAHSIGFSNPINGSFFGGRDLGAGRCLRACNSRPGLLFHRDNACSSLFFDGLHVHCCRESGLFRCIERLL